MSRPYNPKKGKQEDERPVRTVQQMVAALRLTSARQQHLFYNTRKQAFRWEQSLMPQSGEFKQKKGPEHASEPNPLPSGRRAVSSR